MDKDFALSLCCFCGGQKLGWKQRCVVCGKKPTSAPDIIASSILCSLFLPMPDLMAFEPHIRRLGPWRPSRELMDVYAAQRQNPPPNESAAAVMAGMIVKGVLAQRRVEAEVGERMGIGFGKPAVNAPQQDNTMGFLRFVYKAAMPAAITGLLCTVFLDHPGHRILAGLFFIASFSMGAWAFHVYQKAGGR